MSRWSAERLRIGLAPHRVDVARLGMLRGATPARAQSAACAPRAGEPAWQAALEALEAPLAAVARRRQAAAVVLSNHFLRYAVLPWQAELTRPVEVEQLARARFEQVYGAAAAQWTVRAGDGRWGEAHVACAVDGALVAGLRERLDAHGVRLASLQPLLMAAYNDVRRRLDARCAFAVVEFGRVCLGLLDGGRWRDISSRRTAAHAAEAIEQDLATLCSGDAPPLHVVLVGDEGAWWAGAESRAAACGGAPPLATRSLALWGAS